MASLVMIAFIHVLSSHTFISSLFQFLFSYLIFDNLSRFFVVVVVIINRRILYFSYLNSKKETFSRSSFSRVN